MQMEAAMIEFLREQREEFASAYNPVRDAEQILLDAKYSSFDSEGARKAIQEIAGLDFEVAIDIPKWLLFWAEREVRERIEMEVEESWSWELEKFTINPLRFANGPAVEIGRWMERHTINLADTQVFTEDELNAARTANIAETRGESGQHRILIAD